MSAAASHLRLVGIDEVTGEVHDQGLTCPNCAAKQHELDEIVRKLKGMARELGEIRRDKNAEARAHQAWPIAVALFDYWKECTNHPRAKWTEDRFWLLLPHLAQFGPQNCAAAIAGIAHDHFTKQRANGTTVHYDAWETCFKNTGRVEESIRSRPKDWELPPQFETVPRRIVTEEAEVPATLFDVSTAAA